MSIISTNATTASSRPEAIHREHTHQDATVQPQRTARSSAVQPQRTARSSATQPQRTARSSATQPQRTARSSTALARRPGVVALTLACLLGSSGACQTKESSPSSPAASPTVSAEHTKPTKPSTPDDSPSKAPASAADLLDTYEDVRAKLAADQLPGSAAEQLADSAQTAGASQVHTAATKLATIGELEAARKQFGEVSRALVERLRRTPPSEPLYVYECPMAQGYGKWIQKDEPMANPYMGKKMLECGSKSEL